MTIENTVKNFSNNIGNGINLGVHFKSIIDHVVIKRDTTPLVKIINAAINRNDKDIASAIRVTLGKIYIGAKIKTKANKVISIQIKDAKLSNSAVKCLCVVLIGKKLFQLILNLKLLIQRLGRHVWQPLDQIN